MRRGVGVTALVWALESMLLLGEGRAEPPPGVEADRAERPVGALGRIEPRRGVRRVSGPPRPVVVIEKLEVEEGDVVEQGQVLAILQGIALLEADVDRARAELEQAERELRRREGLRRGGAAPDAELEAARLSRDVARASLARARAEVELSRVRAPIAGQVLDVLAREGERVGLDGILELGDTRDMYVVAEVYETDIGRVRMDQRARISSPAFAGDLVGAVERIGLKIGKKDVLGTDPVADNDARVVEVEIRLDDPGPAARLTNLRVDVVLEP